MEKISRKGFLKIAAAAAMSSVTAAGLAACNAASGSSSAAGIVAQTACNFISALIFSQLLWSYF